MHADSRNLFKSQSSSKIIDNFRDESPNLSAIINIDEDDNGSIEMDRKRLSKLSKKDIDK